MKYPVFVFQKDNNMVYVFYKEIHLKSTNTIFLNSQGYNGIRIIDVSGNSYLIKEAFKVRYLGLFGYSLLKKGRQVLVDFKFDDDVQKIDLEIFKEDIIQRIERKKSFWESAWDISELKEKINKSTSFREIADLVK